jgi:hypothetical protein
MRLARLTLALLVCALALVAASPAATPQRLPTKSPLAISGEENGGRVWLSRLDPVTLERRDPQVFVSEWHDGYSFSPDGRRIAFTVSHNATNPVPGLGRVGIDLVDHATGAVTEVQTGVASGALAWLTPNRLVGILQGGTVVVVDTDAGRVIDRDSRVAPGCLDPPGKTATARALVVLLGNRLYAIDRNGTVRSTRIQGMTDECSRHGLAVDEGRERAYVAGVANRVAEVDLRTMRATYRSVPRTTARGNIASRGFLLGGRRLAVAHAVFSRGSPKGVEIVDATRGTRRVIDPRGGRARLAGSKLITWGERAKGVRIFDRGGRRLASMLGNDAIVDVQALGNYAYARALGGKLIVIDLRGPRVVSRSALNRAEVEFLSR